MTVLTNVRTLQENNKITENKNLVEVSLFFLDSLEPHLLFIKFKKITKNMQVTQNRTNRPARR